MEDRIVELELSEKERREIGAFLSRKREQIMWVLYAQGGEITQGELTKEIASTAPSVSNILLKFEQFKYKLLNCESRGVKKYYSLSDIGIAYMKYLSNKDKMKQDDNIISAQGAYLLQEARRTYKYFQDKTDNDGEIQMEDALLHLNFGIGNSTPEDVDMFLRYIYSLEKLIIMGNEVYFDKALQLIQSNILGNWVKRFLKGFYLFLPVLNALEEKEDILDVYTVLESLAKGEVQKAAVIVKEKQWEICCEKVSQFLQKIKGNGRTQDDIYQILYGCMPDKMELAAMLTRIICSQE